MKIGYARVSTPEQNIGSQIDELRNFGCDKIFQDIGSGVKVDRNGLEELKAHLREGDVVVVLKIDRIFRSLKNLVELIDYFNEHKIGFKSLTEPEFDTTSPNGKFLVQIFGAVAEFERNLISERTKIGLKNAKRRKIHLGRPKGPKKENIQKYHFANHLYNNQSLSIIEACKQAQISKASFYRIELHLNNQPKLNDKSKANQVISKTQR